MPGFETRGRVMILLVAVACVAAGPRPASQSSPKQSSVATARSPEWAARGDSEDTQNLYLVGTSRSAAASQAQETAAGAAIDRAASRIAQELFADPAAVSFYSLDALRHYVRTIARVNESWIGSSTSGGYEAFALLQINKTFIRPATVRQYVSSTPPATPPAAVGYLLLPSTMPTTAVTRRTQVRTTKLRDGNFFFHFVIVRQKDALSVRLDRIEVIDDGSPGKTTWRFEVTAAGRPVITRADYSYDDDVGTYRIRPEEKVAFEYPVGRAGTVIEIKITGQKTGGAKKA